MRLCLKHKNIFSTARTEINLRFNKNQESARQNIFRNFQNKNGLLGE